MLALTRNGDRETWLLNGWEKKENAGESSEVSTQFGTTQTNPTFSREDLGSAVSGYRNTYKIGKNNSSSENIRTEDPADELDDALMQIASSTMPTAPSASEYYERHVRTAPSSTYLSGRMKNQDKSPDYLTSS